MINSIGAHIPVMKSMNLFQYIQRLLIDRNVLPWSICYLLPDIDKRLQSQLKQIIEKNNGTVAEKEEEDADDIVYPPTTENPQEIETERQSKDRKRRMYIEICFLIE